MLAISHSNIKKVSFSSQDERSSYVVLARELSRNEINPRRFFQECALSFSSSPVALKADELDVRKHVCIGKYLSISLSNRRDSNIPLGSDCEIDR